MLHIRAIYSRDHYRADVRTRRIVQAETTEKLRDEIEIAHPMLRWPITIITHQRKAI